MKLQIICVEKQCLFIVCYVNSLSERNTGTRNFKNYCNFFVHFGEQTLTTNWMNLKKKLYKAFSFSFTEFYCAYCIFFERLKICTATYNAALEYNIGTVVQQCLTHVVWQ